MQTNSSELESVTLVYGKLARNYQTAVAVVRSAVVWLADLRSPRRIESAVARVIFATLWQGNGT